MEQVSCATANASWWTNASFNGTRPPLLPVSERYAENELLYAYRPAISVIDQYVTPVWYIIGFPGNLLAFLVWIQRRMRPSSGCYLAALAIDDFVFLIMHLIFELQTLWGINTWHVPVWCQLFPVLFYSSQYLSPLLVLAFTVERYIAICHPFQRDRYCTTRRAVVVIAWLVAFSLCVNLIQGYFWTYLDDGVCTVRESVTAELAESLFTIWSWVTELLVFGVVPLVILILNVLVILETRRMTARFSEIAAGGGTSSATTVTLLTVSLYLIFSTLPVTVCFALVLSFPKGAECLTDEELYVDATWQNYFSYWNARILIQELGMSHFACNFLIYLFTSSLFRRELVATGFGGCGGQRGRGRTGYERDEAVQLTTPAPSISHGGGRAAVVGNGGAKNGSSVKGTV